MTIRITIEANPGSWLRPRRLALGAIALAAIAIPLALASDRFMDVPNNNPHHDDISAIAGAGVTTGCGPGLYCPDEPVLREQMASFLRRGIGRVALGDLTPMMSGSGGFPGGTASWSYTITPGLPMNALPGARGFIKVEAVITVRNDVGIKCQIVGNVLLDGVDIVPQDPVDIVDTGEWRTIAITGAGVVSSSGPKTITVQLFDGCAFQTAWGTSTATYYPLGSTGGNTL
jgi:hypothetical protein